jgi:hypothetical protein
LTESKGLEEAIGRVLESAQRLGVELDEQEAAQWIAAMEAETQGTDIVVDVDTGAFGHRASMLDLDPADLAHFRRIAEIVRIPRSSGVQTALALSGSSAQSRIQRYPGDADFFERVHISTPTRAEACRMLGEAIRAKAQATMSGRTHRLAEVKFGTWDAPVTKNGKEVAAGSPVSWTPQEVAAGQMDVIGGDGSPRRLTWEDAAANPGWCKIDWIVADTERGQLANASNCLDATWEAPDGSIVALDGFLDPYFQEVYLDADSKPLFDKLIGELSTDSSTRSGSTASRTPTGARSRAACTTSSGSRRATRKRPTSASCSMSRPPRSTSLPPGCGRSTRRRPTGHRSTARCWSRRSTS